jgi:hypothetical protein
MLIILDGWIEKEISKDYLPSKALDQRGAAAMSKKIRHIDKKHIIHAGLLGAIKAKPIKKIYYGEFGAKTSTGPRGPSKEVLDLIANEEKAAGRPDITVILVRKDTGYPGQIDGRETRQPTPPQRQRAREKMQEAIDAYNPGARNPF